MTMDITCNVQYFLYSQVLNVNAVKLTAEVQICEPVVTDPPNLIDIELVNTHLLSCKNTVPLIELCPVYDESGQYDDTALAVEHVRFVPIFMFLES